MREFHGEDERPRDVSDGDAGAVIADTGRADTLRRVPNGPARHPGLVRLSADRCL